MNIDIIFTVFQATIIAIVLPPIALFVSYMLIPKLQNRSGGRIRRYLSYLIVPPRLEEPGAGSSQVSSLTWRNEKVKIYFYYLGVLLFLVGFVLGEFYEVMIDLILPVTQGSTGEMRIAYSIVFENPLSAVWTGSLPWIGTFAYHETWSWIYFTAAFTDNPAFLSSVSISLTLLSMAVGLAYLAPLAVPRVRRSFLPSMFFFVTGMTVFSKAAISCLAYALTLAFGNAELEYLTLVASGNMIPGLLSVIAMILPVVLVMLSLFVILGRRLWRNHYTDSRSRYWFSVYIALSFFVGFSLTVLMV
jgi:hypothetical protein